MMNPEETERRALKIIDTATAAVKWASIVMMALAVLVLAFLGAKLWQVIHAS